jgi:hypothetical protein
MSNRIRVRRLHAFLVALGLLAAALAAGHASAAGSQRVWMLRGDRPVAVQRPSQTLPSLVRALLAGPTVAERGKGLRTAIPRGTVVRTVSVRGQVVTVDLSARFAAGVDRSSLRDRADQLVRTVLGARGVRAVRLRVEGGVPVGLFPGFEFRRAVTRPYERAGSRLSTRDLQQFLVDLGFMDATGVTGSIDMQTSTAVLGFQKWIGLPRNGILSQPVATALERATRPQPALRQPGRRIEVHLDRQLALLIENGRLIRVVHISSGAFGKTPEGSFHVFRKERLSWSVPFKVWLPWASYFVGGVAFHEFGSVPIYAASHGCIRVNHYDAEMLYGFATVGTQVDVFNAVRV